MNFATGSACTHDWGIPNMDSYCALHPYNNDLLPLTYANTLYDQITAWKEYDVPLSTANEALFAIFIGGNDMNAILQIDGDLIQDIEDVFDRDDDMVSNIVSGITDLHDAGARNFLILNMPSVLISPRGLTATTNQIFSDVAYKIIGQYLEKLQKEIDNNFGLNDSTILPANIYGCLNQLSGGYYGGFAGNGYNLTTEPCIADILDQNTTICGDPSSAVWWNDIHPTTSFHAFIAKLLNDYLTDVPNTCMANNCIERSWFGILGNCFVEQGVVNDLWIIIGCVGGVIVIIFGCIIYWCYKKIQEKRDEGEADYGLI